MARYLYSYAPTRIPNTGFYHALTGNTNVAHIRGLWNIYEISYKNMTTNKHDQIHLSTSVSLPWVFPCHRAHLVSATAPACWYPTSISTGSSWACSRDQMIGAATQKSGGLPVHGLTLAKVVSVSQGSWVMFCWDMFSESNDWMKDPGISIASLQWSCRSSSRHGDRTKVASRCLNQQVCMLFDQAWHWMQPSLLINHSMGIVIDGQSGQSKE